MKQISTTDKKANQLVKKAKRKPHKKDEIVNKYIEMLSHKKWHIRESSAKALGMIGDNRAVDPLKEKVRGKKRSELVESVEIATFEALAILGDWTAAESLAFRMIVSRVSMINEFGKSLDKMNDKLFNNFCSDITRKLPDMQIKVIEGLESIRSKRVIIILKKVLEHYDHSARKRAATALINIAKSNPDVKLEQNYIDMMTKPHIDNDLHDDNGANHHCTVHDDNPNHIDQGIGVDVDF